MRLPDHPEQRIPSNLARFAGNLSLPVAPPFTLPFSWSFLVSEMLKCLAKHSNFFFLLTSSAKNQRNYLNIIFWTGLMTSATARPIFVSVCTAVELIALFAPPEMFDVDVMQSRAAGGGFRSIGGPWLRYFLAAFAQLGWLCSCFLCHFGQRGLIIGCLLVLCHALFKSRPWTVVAKENLKSKLS